VKRPKNKGAVASTADEKGYREVEPWMGHRHWACNEPNCAFDSIDESVTSEHSRYHLTLAQMKSRVLGPLLVTRRRRKTGTKFSDLLEELVSVFKRFLVLPEHGERRAAPAPVVAGFCAPPLPLIPSSRTAPGRGRRRCRSAPTVGGREVT